MLSCVREQALADHLLPNRPSIRDYRQAFLGRRVLGLPAAADASVAELSRELQKYYPDTYWFAPQENRCEPWEERIAGSFCGIT